MAEAENRQQAEASLRQSERRARALLNAPPDFALLTDLDGTILEINEVAASRFGLKIEDAIGKNAFSFFDPELADKSRSRGDKLVETKEPVTWEDERGGRVYENYLYPIQDDENRLSASQYSPGISPSSKR